MPAFYTHYTFGKDVKKKSKLKNIDDNLYNIFNQSFDSFYFYNFYFPFYGKKVRKIAYIGHRKNVNKYFINIIKYMKEHDCANDSKTRAFLYGSLNHYILDSTIHPYIFYLTGVYNNEDPLSFKYNGLHSEAEFSIDAYLYKKKHNLPYYKKNITKSIFLKPIFNDKLYSCIDKVFYKTFDIENGGKNYIKSIRDYRFTYKYFYSDKYGIKKRLLSILDKITGKKVINLKYHTTNYKDINKKYLNLDRNSWRHPSLKDDKKNDSFFDLYEEGLIKSNLIIDEIEKYFNDLSSIDLVKSLIQNNSYVTGLDINKNKKMKYFKF